MTAGRRAIKVPARIVQFPRSISQEASDNLERLVSDDGRPLNSLHDVPSFADHEAWRAIQSRVNEQYTASARKVSATLRSAVETRQIAQTVLHVATPDKHDTPDRVMIEFHGGALVVGGGEACRVGAQLQADLHGVRCFAVDYRMPPDHPYPAALDDALAAYRHVLGLYGSARIVVNGRSAGGNIAAAMLLRAKDEGLPMPGGLILLSPEADLTESGDSFQVNKLVDVVLPGSLMSQNLLYAGTANLEHPYLSPLFGDLSSFPPTFIQSGTRDLLLSNAVRMHRALLKAGRRAELHIFEGMPHGGFLGATPEDIELSKNVARFAAQCWTNPK